MKTAVAPYPSQWMRVKRGFRLSGDVLRMLPWTMAGLTTITDGSGIIHKFEAAFSRLTGSGFALAMTNGTATLHSAYFAVGVGPGTEVIVPSYTWHASATPVLQCGATPVFCDIDPRTLTADPDDIERRITDRTKAICVVHVWGNPAEMDRIVAIANRHKIKVIEDCSHAHGAVYKGKAVGTWGAIGCFSLNSGKGVDGGEGGVAVTDDPVLFDHMLILGHFGRVQNGQAARTFNIGDMSLGMKYRPHTASIYLAMASLKRLHDLNARCERTWGWLCEEIDGIRGLRPQFTLPDALRGGYMSYVMIYEGEGLGGPPRDQFVDAVRQQGAPLSADRYSQINYTYGMLHQAPLFTTLDRRGLGGGCYDNTRPWAENIVKVSLPVCERVAKQLVSFPRLDQASERFVRSCGRALRKVMSSLVPQSQLTPILAVMVSKVEGGRTAGALQK
jgi:dTDP-4-amino-4,6-dideoxygalactose transaminase